MGPTTTDPVPSVSGGPIDNLYLPGLGAQAGLETDPVTTNNQQIVAELGAGSLRIDGVSTPFTCSGPGVAGQRGVLDRAGPGRKDHVGDLREQLSGPGPRQPVPSPGSVP